jgi:hypothetical protein
VSYTSLLQDGIIIVFFGVINFSSTTALSSSATTIDLLVREAYCQDDPAWLHGVLVPVVVVFTSVAVVVVVGTRSSRSRPDHHHVAHIAVVRVCIPPDHRRRVIEFY